MTAVMSVAVRAAGRDVDEAAEAERVTQGRRVAERNIFTFGPAPSGTDPAGAGLPQPVGPIGAIGSSIRLRFDIPKRGLYPKQEKSVSSTCLHGAGVFLNRRGIGVE